MFAKRWLWITFVLVVGWSGTAIAQPAIATTPAATHSFGAVRFNNSAATHTATLDLSISNSGDEDLVVNSITPVDGQSNDYDVAGTLPATIAAGTAASFTITFDPAAAGASSTTLAIASNDPVTPTKNIALTGTGATGVISVTDPTISATRGGTASQNITISNAGTGTRGPLAVTQAQLTTNGDNWFRFNGATCPNTTAPCPLALSLTTGTATLPVVCSPPVNATGYQQATVLFTSDTDDATDSESTITCNLPPISALDPTSLSFGAIEVGNMATGQMVTLKNDGGAPLTITAAGLLPAGAADYTVTGTTGTGLSVTLQPTQSTSWTIACKPSTHGSRSGTFRITSNHNGAAGTNQNITLSCTGQQGVLAFDTPPANPFDFGGVRENETRMQAFTLRNTGNVAVTNISVAFTGTGTGYSVTPTTTIASLDPNATVTVNATFAPLSGNDGGTYTATYTGSWGTSKSTSAALTLNGDGLATGYDTNPSSATPLDFGSIRFDQTKLMQVTVINTAGAPLQIRGFTITPLTALTGEFTVTRCFKNNVQITCPTVVAPYNSSGINDTIVLEVRFDPANRVAMMDATLTINSDLPTNPTRTVTLKGTSITADITLDPQNMVLDFGPTDLDASPVTVTRMVSLKNSGSAPLDFTSVTKTGARFTFSTTPAPATVQPNGTYSITVSYTPTIERPSNQPDTGSIVFGGVAGAFGAPSTVTIQLTGYGIDRHISVAPAPTFPDTYKNPGELAPVMPVTVTNTGDAPLDISAVMVTNEPIWTLVNPEPVTVAGKGTHAFDVKFSPQTAGKAPVGHLTIMNNDNGMPLVAVDLNGNGIARNVAVGPGVIDLGFVGIGMTVKLSAIAPSEVLSVANADTTMFPITRVEVSGDHGSFVVLPSGGGTLDPENPLPLLPSTTQTFDIEFTPTHEGALEATAVVFLGDDPQPAVTLRGRGLYVDTGGGGGCTTSRGGGLGMILVVLAAVLCTRRRRSAALVGMLVGMLVGTLVSTPAAYAEQTRDVDLPLFDPTPSASTETTFHVQSARVAESGSLGVFALVSYASQPLVLRTSQNDAAAVDSRTTLELGGAYAVGRFEFGARMPLHLQSGDALPTPEQRRDMFGIEPGDTARGDLALHGKVQLGATGGVAYGAGVAVTAPTATGGQFAGNAKPTARAQLLLSIVRGPLTTILNAGGVLREQAEVGNTIQKSGGVFGAGMSLRVRDKLWLAGEVYGELVPGGKTGQPAPGAAMGAAELGKPIEGLFGLRFQLARTTNLGLAIGRGLTSDMGSPALRGVLALSLTPSAEPLKPLRPARPPEPPKDTDGDGIPDKLDACPNEPEDKDLFDDGDGCPDLDNDGDGIPDADDKCPLDPEDKDGFQDDDGCPDNDNDGDGIPDAMDKCPNAPEDRDGFQDHDGCPDPDNDGDGLLDTVDKCPLEPETINGIDDDDGCPDKGNGLVVMSPDRLETLEAIQFNGSKLARSSFNLLGQIGATLRAHPRVARVRITVHVNPTRNAAADKALTEQRAKAIREWLIEWGVDPLRLQAAGFGGGKPLVPASQRGAKEINNRVELIVLERN
jgi:outer membrane protein OmpA-like peptidoglycan-associated protein